jgi:hypothetical protein
VTRQGRMARHDPFAGSCDRHQTGKQRREGTGRGVPDQMTDSTRRNPGLFRFAEEEKVSGARSEGKADAVQLLRREKLRRV